MVVKSSQAECEVYQTVSSISLTHNRRTSGRRTQNDASKLHVSAAYSVAVQPCRTLLSLQVFVRHCCAHLFYFIQFTAHHFPA